MFSYIKGTVAFLQKFNKKIIVTLDISGIGIDIQIPTRIMPEIPEPGEEFKLFTHLQVREDAWQLFGFLSINERDLFAQLISVSGVGPQLGVALMSTLQPQEMVQAIVTGNYRILARTPGVGAKSAERICIELRKKLAEWHQESGLSGDSQISTGLSAVDQESVEFTLIALGYTGKEIEQAFSAISLSKPTDVEDWIRQSIGWISGNCQC